MDALQDLEMLLGTGLTTTDVFIRLTDCLIKLGQCNRLLAEYNGDILNHT